MIIGISIVTLFTLFMMDSISTLCRKALSRAVIFIDLIPVITQFSRLKYSITAAAVMEYFNRENCVMTGIKSMKMTARLSAFLQSVEMESIMKRVKSVTMEIPMIMMNV